MTLGERCDEIVRLIDETLGSVAEEIDSFGLGSSQSGVETKVPELPARDRVWAI